MKISLPFDYSITIRTGLGVIYNALFAGFLGLLTALVWAAAGFSEICTVYAVVNFYGVLAGLIWGRFTVRDPVRRGLYDEAFHYILRHIPCRKKTPGQILVVLFAFCLYIPFVLVVELECTLRAWLKALAQRACHMSQRAALAVAELRYLLLAHSFLSHAPPLL